jgi:hypothetical protein
MIATIYLAEAGPNKTVDTLITCEFDRWTKEASNLEYKNIYSILILTLGYLVVRSSTCVQFFEQMKHCCAPMIKTSDHRFSTIKMSCLLLGC